MKKILQKFCLYSLSITLLMCLSAAKIHAQIVDSSGNPLMINCGADGDYFLHGAHYPSSGYSPISITPFDTAAIFTCGKVSFYYEDVNRHFNTGFDDTTLVGGITLGAIRRRTLCEVADYMQSVFDFSNVPDSSPIRIYVDTSYSHTFHLYPHVPSQFFAVATPRYDTTAGIKSGWMNDYIRTGTDPASGLFHALIQVNFDKFFIFAAGGALVDSINIPWQENADTVFNNLTSCGKADLFSVLAHEMGHCMGWISFVRFQSTGGFMGLRPYPIVTPRVFSNLDWSMHVGSNTYPLSLTKLIAPPITAPSLDSSNPVFRSFSNYWLNDSVAPKNLPVYSGSFLTTGSVSSFLSHLDDQLFGYSFRQRISPGDQQCYLMGPNFKFGVLRRSLSKGELQSFVDILGYTLNPAFDSSHPDLYRNHTPFSRKMAQYPIDINNYAYFTEEVTPDDTLTNNVGATRTVYLDTMIVRGDVTDTDAADIPNIYIDSTTIVNFRGCGNGGNNHSQLTISGDCKSITYTPRADFYGKAQFGFNINDGKEQGSFIVMTIEVYKGTNVTCPFLSNMICNPDFEEGSEIKIAITDEAVPNVTVGESAGQEGRWQGICFSDSHPYCFHSNLLNNHLYYCSGTVVHNSHFGPGESSTCGISDTSTSENGTILLTFPTPYTYSEGPGGSSFLPYDNPMPKDSIGNRYQMFSRPAQSYYLLKDSARHCHRYTLEFDLFRTFIAGYDTMPVTVGFADHLANLRTVNPDTTFNFSYVDTVYDTVAHTTHEWKHYALNFWYCGTNPSNILYLRAGLTAVVPQFHLDNLSLKEDTTAPPPLLVGISQSIVDSCTKRLTVRDTNAACEVTYYWTGGGITGETTVTVNVVPTVTTTYTVTINDGCRSATTTITVTVNSLSAIGGSSLVCIGGTRTLSHSYPGGVWISSATGIATVGSSNGIVSGISVGTATITYTVCGRFAIRVVTVNALPAAITGTLHVCVGATTTVSDATPGGTWSSTGANATVGALTGILTGISAGTAVISYTVSSTSCFVTAIATINPIPAAILGASSVCEGSTISLVCSGAGVWSSSDTTIATVDSAAPSVGTVTGISAGVVTITYTGANGCYSITTVSVHVLPAPITGITTVCIGTTTTLSNATPGGTWYISGTGTATIGATTGIVTGVNVGAAPAWYTTIGPCHAMTTVSVISSTYITGTLIMCEGSTTTLSGAPPFGGGTWSSSNTGVATVGSSTGIVTGISGGTSTITYSFGPSCYGTATMTINPLPAAITGTPMACIARTTTLSNATSGGIWSSSNTAVGTVGSVTGIVTGISAGTIVITYALPTGCYVTAFLTVNPLPSPITGPSAVCYPDTILLADATPGGSWSATFVAVTSLGEVAGIAVGVGTVTYTLSTGCFRTKSITVNPIPASITGNIYFCLGSAVTLGNTTTGGTWSSSTPTVASVGSASGIVTGLNVGTSIISYSLSTGCKSTQEVSVFDTLACSPCKELASSFSPLGLSGVISSAVPAGNYYLTNNVTITSTTTFTNAIVLIDTGVTIFVDTASQLLLDGSHLFGKCNMWDGIVLSPGITHSGRLSMTNLALVEDAMTAVYINQPVVPTTGYVLITDEAIFNKNVTGVHIAHFTSLDTTYPFKIRNTVFTSRDFTNFTAASLSYPQVWPPTTGSTGLKTYWNPGDIFSPPFNVDNPDAGGTGIAYAGAVCKGGQRPNIGIKLDSVGWYTAPYTEFYEVVIPNYYSEIVIGDTIQASGNPFQNLFDNLAYGIHATHANVTVVNNAFIHMVPYNYMSGPVTGGNGIYAIQPNDWYNHNRLRIHSPNGNPYHNLFYGFYNAVESYNYFQTIGLNTYMINKGPSTNFNPSGNAGYKVSSAQFDTIDITYDTITNVNYGIQVSATFHPYLHTMGARVQFTGRCRIDANLIQAHPYGYDSITTQGVFMAISLQNTLATHGRVDAGWMNWASTSYNQIFDAHNGIFVNDFWRQNAFSNSNDIQIRPYPAPGKWLQFGLNHTVCRKSEMYTNDITASVSSIQRDSMRAFYTVACTGINIGCNTEENTGRGYEFFMTSPATAWHDNMMDKNGKGMILNGATINSQNYGGHPMNNQWSTGFTWDSTHPQTYVYHGANALFSPFYVNDAPGTNPTINKGDISFPLRDYIHTVSIFTVSATYASPCPIPDPDDPMYALRAYEEIAQEHVSYTDNIVPSNWIGQYELWKNIKADSTLIDSSNVIRVFDSMAQHSRYAYITEMENLLANGYFDSVTAMLEFDIDSMANTSTDSATQVKMGDTTAANAIVMNYQEFFRLYIKYMELSLTSTDSLDLVVIAGLCPQRNGTVVFQARALYSEVFNEINLFYDDSCIDADTGYIAEKHTKDNRGITGLEQKYQLYPNPNDGSFVLQQYMRDEEPVATVVYDVIGRKVFSKQVLFDNPKSILNIGDYPPGLYLLEIKDSKNRIFRFKFVISK